jgi:hypothetical protein
MGKNWQEKREKDTGRCTTLLQVGNCTKTTPKTQKTNEILRKTETDKWVQPVRALPGGSKKAKGPPHLHRTPTLL